MPDRPRRHRVSERDRRRRAARRQVTASAGGLSLEGALEQLEARQLLAITVTEQNLASYRVGADYIFTDATSITVAPSLVIDAGGGKQVIKLDPIQDVTAGQ